MARYAGLLLAPAEGFGRGIFCPSGKKRAFYALMAHFWQFWCPVVTVLTFTSNFERNQQKKIQKKKLKK